MLDKTLKEFRNIDEVLKEFHEFEEENRVKKQLVEDRVSDISLSSTNKDRLINLHRKHGQGDK